VAVTLDSQTLRRVDRLVRDARYPNRSQAIEAAVAAQLERLEHRRLADECAKLDPAAERAMAEEGLGLDAAGWPEYDVFNERSGTVIAVALTSHSGLVFRSRSS
jgi:Arc/MetJ-type ribon-helix-helix transcriptional regulator